MDEAALKQRGLDPLRPSPTCTRPPTSSPGRWPRTSTIATTTPSRRPASPRCAPSISSTSPPVLALAGDNAAIARRAAERLVAFEEVLAEAPSTTWRCATPVTWEIPSHPAALRGVVSAAARERGSAVAVSARPPPTPPPR